MTESPHLPGPWQFSTTADGGAIAATLRLDQSPEAIAQRRKLYHDYVGAIRTLRYLAQKALQGGEEEAKREALQRHLRNLDLLQRIVIDPLLRGEGFHDA